MGKVILLNLVIYCFTLLWSMLFVIPGIVAAYRYRFALYNLYENPGLNVMEALEMSKRQTRGYKGQLFMLDLSYFGWYLLASLPVLAEFFYGYFLIFQDPGYYLADLTGSPPFPCPSPGGCRSCWTTCGDGAGGLLPAGVPVYGAGVFRHRPADLRRGRQCPGQPEDGGWSGF